MRKNKGVARRKNGIQLEFVAGVCGVVDLELHEIIIALDSSNHCAPALSILYLETTIVFSSVCALLTKHIYRAS